MHRYRLFAIAPFLLLAAATFASNLSRMRAGSLYFSQAFLNEQLKKHVKSDLVENLNIDFDPDRDHMYLRGVLRVPLEELRAINWDPRLSRFQFQVSLRSSIDSHGNLVFEFPLNETFFYPESSKNPDRDRVLIPVQMLSLALASVRGYLAALSGDFKGFDRRTARLNHQLKEITREIAEENNPSTREDLRTEREALRLRLEAIPIERKQLESLSKQLGAMLGFIGEKELTLNDKLAAQDNTLIFKVKLSQLVPYLTGVELGGVRLVHSKKEGGGQNYLAIDIDTETVSRVSAPNKSNALHKNNPKVAPSLVVRLNQALFESEALVSAEKKQMGTKITDFDLQLKEDGIHVSGNYHAFLFAIPFDAVIDFVSKTTDRFEVRMRKVSVAGIDFDFLSKVALDSIKNRLDHSLKGICIFEDMGEQEDHSRSLQVTVDPKRLVPAIPNMHLIEVVVREREMLLKVGRT